MNDIDEVFGAVFGESYDYTVTDGALYYRWGIKSDKLITNTNFDWQKIFIPIDPISYRSTEKLSEDKKLFKYQINGIEYEKELYTTIKTGYLIPNFNFISAQIRSYVPSSDEYNRVLELFKLTQGLEIDANSFQPIIMYRDALFNQIQRYAIEISRINSEIIDVLKVIYHSTDRMYLKGKPEDYSEDKRMHNAKAFAEVTRHLRNFYEGLITTGAKLKLIQSHVFTERLLKNQIIDPEIGRSCENGIKILASKRDPLISVATDLANKLISVETLIENILSNDKIKTLREISDSKYFLELPDPKYTAESFYNNPKNRVKKYEVEIIEDVHEITRNFIFENKITSIRGKKRTISREVVRLKHTFSEINPKTLDKWILHYWNCYKPDNNSD